MRTFKVMSLLLLTATFAAPVAEPAFAQVNTSDSLSAQTAEVFHTMAIETNQECLDKVADKSFCSKVVGKIFARSRLRDRCLMGEPEKLKKVAAGTTTTETVNVVEASTSGTRPMYSIPLYQGCMSNPDNAALSVAERDKKCTSSTTTWKKLGDVPAGNRCESSLIRQTSASTYYPTNHNGIRGMSVCKSTTVTKTTPGAVTLNVPAANEWTPAWEWMESAAAVYAGIPLIEVDQKLCKVAFGQSVQTVLNPPIPIPAPTPAPTPAGAAKIVEQTPVGPNGQDFTLEGLPAIASGTVKAELKLINAAPHSVCFYKDATLANPGTPIGPCEGGAPYCIGGDNGTVCNGFNTTTWTNGRHTIKALILFKVNAQDRYVEKVYEFNVQN